MSSIRRRRSTQRRNYINFQCLSSSFTKCPIIIGKNRVEQRVSEADIFRVMFVFNQAIVINGGLFEAVQVP